MNYHPRISIITPSFNQGPWLEETIQSVLKQDYPNLEYIIMDGGSTDNSVEIIRKHERHLAYWISEKDRGQTDAINRGMQRATGDIVAWLNSDDVYVPGALAAVAAEFKRAPADVVYGDYILTTARGRPFLKRREIPFDFDLLLYGSNFIGQPSSFIQSDAFRRFGYLDESLCYLMDYEFWLRIAARGASFRHIKQFLSLYRYHPASKTVGQEGGFHREFQNVRSRYRERESSLAAALKTNRARFQRQWIKLWYQGTFDYLGGPLRWLAYRWADRQ
jgi:glycosyltransferase involved in cell wall biosynthesis